MHLGIIKRACLISVLLYLQRYSEEIEEGLKEVALLAFQNRLPSKETYKDYFLIDSWCSPDVYSPLLSLLAFLHEDREFLSKHTVRTDKKASIFRNASLISGQSLIS